MTERRRPRNQTVARQSRAARQAAQEASQRAPRGPLPPSDQPAKPETPPRWTPADAALQAGMARAQDRARRAAVNYYRYCLRRYQ